MPLFADLPLITTLPNTANLMVIVGVDEWQCTLAQLSEHISSASTVNSSDATVIASGTTTYHPSNYDFAVGHESFFTTLTSNLHVTLPTIPAARVRGGATLVLDSRQDAIGGRNITFGNVAGWYNVNPYNTSNPTELQINKTANSYSMFSFRVVNGFWFGNYNKVI